MRLFDLNKDGKVGNLERAAGFALLASELDRMEKERDAVGASASWSARSSSRRGAKKPLAPSRLDGAIGIVALVAVVTLVLTVLLVLGTAFSELDTSGMSYEEAMRAIDRRYLPPIICGAVGIVSWVAVLVLSFLAPSFPVGDGKGCGPDGRARL